MQFIPLALYLFLCVLIAIAGRKSRVGPAGLFLLSLIFTPLVVGIVLALVLPNRSRTAATKADGQKNSG